MVTTVYFIRHVQAQGNVNRTFQGSTDTEVSEGGKIQLDNLTQKFSDISVDAVYSSPLKRAAKSADAVRGNRDVPLVLDDRLREFNAGVWEGQSFTRLTEDYPDLRDIWDNRMWEFKVEGSEDMGAVTDRVALALRDILKDNVGKTVVITSHGCALRMLINYALGNPLEGVSQIGWMKNAGITKIEFDSGVPGKMIYFNDLEHVDESTYIA